MPFYINNRFSFRLLGMRMDIKRVAGKKKELKGIGKSIDKNQNGR